MARPSKFKKKYCKKAKKLTEKGFTDGDLAKFFSVDEKTINNWKYQFPLFFQSLKNGKKIADSKVEASLYQRATGYSCPDVHVTNYLGVVTITPIIKHYPPDPTSCIFWLKNRKPKEWRDRQEFAVTELPPIKVIYEKN